MRGVVHHGRLDSDRAIAEVGRHTVQRGFCPQAVLRHDLVELLELAEAGDVALPFGLVDSRDREATGACEGWIFSEFLVDELGLGRLSGEHDAEESLEHGKETLGRSSCETGRSDVWMDRFGTDGDRRRFARSKSVQHRSIFVEGGSVEEQTSGGLWLGFWIGRGWVLPTLVSLLGLLLVELPELLVVPSPRGLELPVIELSQDVEPEGIGFVLKKQVVRFDEFNQGQLAGRVDDSYHDEVLHADEEFLKTDCLLLRWMEDSLLR